MINKSGSVRFAWLFFFTFLVMSVPFFLSIINIYSSVVLGKYIYSVNQASVSVLPAALYVDLFFFMFVVVLSQFADGASVKKSNYMNPFGLLWAALMVFLSIIPTMAVVTVALFSGRDEVNNDLIYCYVTLVFRSEDLNLVSKYYQFIIISNFVSCVVFAVLVSIRLNKARLRADAVIQSRTTFVLSLASVLVASICLSIYLSISHLESPYEICNKEVEEPVKAVLFSISKMIVVVFISILASRLYAAYLLVPWVLANMRKKVILFIKLLVLCFSIFFLASLIFRFMVNIKIVENFDSVEAIAKVLFLDITTGVFEYIKVVVDLVVYLVFLFSNFVKSIFDFMIDNQYITLSFAAVVAIFLYKVKYFNLIGVAVSVVIMSSRKINSVFIAVIKYFMILWRYIFLCVIFLVLVYWIFSLVVGGLQVQKEHKAFDGIEESVQNPDIQQVNITCRDYFPTWSLGQSDMVDMSIDQCEVESDICSYDTLVALGVSSAQGNREVELKRAKSRGEELARSLFGRYRSSCGNNAVAPKLYVLNLGQPQNINNDQRAHRSVKAFMGRSISNETMLDGMLMQEVKKSDYRNWDLISISN